MGTLNLEGNLILGPQNACEGNITGAGVLNLPFGLGAPGGCGGCVSAARSTYNTPSINSPAAYVAMPGLGANQSVTKGLFLYLRSSQACSIRLTQDTVVTPQTVEVNGLCIMQFPTDKALTLLEVKGSVSVEYVITGNQ